MENVSLHSDLKYVQRVSVSHHNEEVIFELATDVPESLRDHRVKSFYPVRDEFLVLSSRRTADKQVFLPKHFRRGEVREFLKPVIFIFVCPVFSSFRGAHASVDIKHNMNVVKLPKFSALLC
jgi:5-formyltetrahydrofolate cyclo-ligase